MQVCTSLQTDNHANTPPLFLQAGCPSCRPTNSVKALKAQALKAHLNLKANSHRHAIHDRQDCFVVSGGGVNWAAARSLTRTIVSNPVRTPVYSCQSSGVTSHRQPQQCRWAQGPKTVKGAQNDPNYVSRLLARSECLPGAKNYSYATGWWAYDGIPYQVKHRAGDRGITAENMEKSSIPISTKIRLMKALVRPVTTYGCESWTPTKNEETLLDAFEMKGPRKILRVS